MIRNRVRQEPIFLKEFEEKEIDLTESDVTVLENEFTGRIDVKWSRHGRVIIRAKEYVGTTVLPDHLLVIRPKIEQINFLRMLAYSYDLLDFGTPFFPYDEKDEIHEIIIGVFLDAVQSLVRTGLSKDYFTEEDNLPFLRGRWLVVDDLIRNSSAPSRICCRFAEFSSDTFENRIIKLALYKLSEMNLGMEDVQRRAQQLLRDFTSISQIAEFQIPDVVYNRLNEHYKPIINSALFIIRNSSISMERRGERTFYSFLVNMEVLFETFLRNFLRNSTVARRYQIVGSPRGKAIYHTLESGKFGTKPDIIVRRSGKPILVIDAKYKQVASLDDIVQADINEVIVYCHSTGARLAVLVYPQAGHFVLHGIPDRVKRTEVLVALKTILLDPIDGPGFLARAAAFAEYVLLQASSLETGNKSN